MGLTEILYLKVKYKIMEKLSDYKKNSKNARICFDLRNTPISNIDEMLNAAKYFYDIIMPQYFIFFEIKCPESDILNVFYVVNTLVDWGVLYKNISLRCYFKDKELDYTPLLSLGVKISYPPAVSIIEVSFPHYSCCNKNIYFTVKQGITYVCQGWCCGNKIDVHKYFLSFDKSLFLYRFSRDFVYCEQLIKVRKSSKKFIFGNPERDMSLTTDCYGEMKPARELFVC